MLVRDMIKAIENNELKIKDLEEMYSFSDRTIQKRIGDLGFKWMPNEGKYDFIGTDESVYDLPLDEVFKSKSPSRKKNTNKSEITSENKVEIEAKIEVEKAIEENIQETAITTPEIDSNDTSISTNNITTFKKSRRRSAKATSKESENIARLLAGQKVKRTYRGFYFDDDVLSVIDSVDNGIKSELINECLRKVFKDMGAL